MTLPGPSVVTPPQLEALRAIAARPSGRLEDWAVACGVSAHAMSLRIRQLVRKGYVRRIPISSRRSRYELSDRCGCCPRCLRPQLVESLHVISRDRKLDPETRRQIALSQGKAEAVARRFGVDASWVRKIRAKPKATECAVPGGAA